MKPQVISRDGQPEYAVLPWAQYLKLLEAAQGSQQAVSPEPVAESVPATALDDITRLREAKGLSIEQLARAVGVSPHYLAMIESGEREPDAAIQRALAWNLSGPQSEANS